MQPAEHRLGDDLRGGRSGGNGHSGRAGRLMIQASMRPVCVVVLNELINRLLQMPRVEDKHMIQTLVGRKNSIRDRDDQKQASITKRPAFTRRRTVTGNGLERVKQDAKLSHTQKDTTGLAPRQGTQPRNPATPRNVSTCFGQLVKR